MWLTNYVHGYRPLITSTNKTSSPHTNNRATAVLRLVMAVGLIIVAIVNLLPPLVTHPSLVQDNIESDNPSFSKQTTSPCINRRKEHCGLGPSAPRVIYMHIPKAGGTSIQTAMRGWVEKSNTAAAASYFNANGPSYSKSSFTCPPGSLLHTVLTGHRGFGFCRDVEHDRRRGIFTFTAFREPVARAISLFDYNLVTMEDPKQIWDKVFNNNKQETLNAAIKRFNSTEEIEKGEALLRFSGSQQTRFLCGYQCMGPNVRGNETYTNAFMLEKAKINLLKLDVVGVSERLDELIPQLKMHLALVPRGFSKWPESNTQSIKKKSVLDDEAKAILQRWTETDAELYRLANDIAIANAKKVERCTL